ncbi:hypothetical protein [Streptomyces pinistramenti]|uniref:hypothetical protein n=1 Tax=Streptomyces pinistramenti TaxID=2884812 RepID=UPI001D0762BB|nr:hypothetical protein [Streptomyces pinistramenti]MCB5912407.1 hypothetical protein [Streptomyces pinistramenti]
MTTDTTSVRGSDAEPTEKELRDLAAEHNIAIPNRPPLGLVRRSRYDNLSDDLVAALVALAKAKDDVRYWMGRFDEAHDRATAADLSATAARAAYDVANERAEQAEAERDQLKQHQDDETDPQPPAGTAHYTYGAAEMAQHLEDGCADCAATLPDQSDIFLVEVAHAARDAGAAVALFLLLQDLDRRNLVKKETP